MSYLIKLDSYFFLAQFLVEFDGSTQFYEFIDSLQEHDESRLGTPNYIAANIRGVGFVLACDALKELGYEEYPKPDLHLRDVCKAFELSNGRDITTFKAIRELAESCKVTPYKIDKMIWLVCSGSFYKDKDPNDKNKTLKVSSRKKELLKRAAEM